MGEGKRDGGTGKKTLTLLSPVGGPPLTYTWPLQQLVRGKCAVDEAHELLDTIRWVVTEHPVLREGPLENATKNIVISDYGCMKELCDLYNSETKKLPCQTNSTNREPASKALLRVVLHRTYSHAVFDPEKLNSYQPFSPEVYGETSFEMIDQLIEDVPFKKGATFLDLGSGVGQVVLQVAASNICRICYGIEQAATPCYYAKAMEKHFVRWMNFFGKPYSEFKMLEGDFLDDKYRSILQNSNTIFVNNFAFGPSLNHKLKERFAKFPEGVKIISSAEFRPINFRITTRNITDVGTILRVREVHPRVPGSVSWTNNDVCYFIHTVDRSYLEEYMRLQRAKYGDKLESLMMNADRKIKERCEDYKALPALSLENDRRTHLLSNLTEIEVPKVSSISDLHDLLNSQLSEYLSQCSSSYGEAALQLELEQSRILKERLEEQLELLDRNVQTEEEQVVAALDSRLSELGLKSRDPQGIGKELLYQVNGFKILHKRLDRLSSEVSNYQTAIKSSLLREVSTWRDNHERYSEYAAEVGLKQKLYQEVLSQLPGYDFKVLATSCQEQARGFKDRTKSLSKLLSNIASLEKDNLQLEKELAVKREKLAAKKKAEDMAAAAAAAEAAKLAALPPPKPVPKPEVAAVKPVSGQMSAPHLMPVPAPVPVSVPPKPSTPKPQLIGPPKQPHPSQAPPPPVKIPTELTKPRPKPSVVIEQPSMSDVRPDAKDNSQGMSHLDAILARNGLGHYIGNDYNTKRPEEYLLTGHDQYRRSRDRSETKSGENTPSRPSSTTSNISHRSILQQQHKQINNINSLLIQQQTMAQLEQKNALGSSDIGFTSAGIRGNPDNAMLRNEQALLNEQMMHIEAPARAELKQTEEKVLSSGTVPAKYPGSNPGYKEKTGSMLKTTSPRLQLTTQASSTKQTVLVPHYMLGNNKDSTTAETMMAVKPSSASTPGSATSISTVKSTPVPKPTAGTPSHPSTASTQLSATISQLGSSSSSYFSAYGSNTDPLAQKTADHSYPGPLPPAKTTAEGPKAQIPKPKHKYPFQYLNQVYITGYAIMIHTLKAQYPNLRPELFNDLLSRSNFNPYTYFEYLKKLDNFESTLESFYEMRPDLGEKCKTRAQKLAEKESSQKLAEKQQQSGQQSATAAVPSLSSSMPIPPSSIAPSAPLNSRPVKEPQISAPRHASNPTIIESYISKGPPPPTINIPQPPPPGPITTELRLTKPSRDLKSPPQIPFKSPTSSIHYPGESPNKTSPAKRPECSLQYHHLSLESFKNEPKNKVRRRNASSDVKHRNASESDKISPTKNKEVKRSDDVTETAMMMLQLHQSMQQKHTMQKKPDVIQMTDNPRAELERQLALSESQAISSGDKAREHPQYRHDRPKHNSGTGRPEPYPKEHVYRTNKVPESAPKTNVSRSLPEYPGNQQVHEYGMKMNPQYREPAPPYRSRESSGQYSHGDPEEKVRDDQMGNGRNGHISDPKSVKMNDPSKDRHRDPFQYQDSHIPNQQLRNSNYYPRDGNSTMYRDPHSQRDTHVSRDGHSVREGTHRDNSHPPPGHVSRDPNGLARENHVQGRDLHRDPHQQAGQHPNVTLRTGSSRDHQRSNNRAPPSSQHQAPVLSNHRDSNNNNNINNNNMNRPASRHGEKVSPKDKEKSTPKMPDLNKPTSYNSMDHMKHLELQKELKGAATASAKPPLHNPRTHMITSASIPPPELKKARNFKDVHPRDLPSQPPEMRMAPNHIDSRASYVSHQVGNLPHPVNNRPEERKKVDEKKRVEEKAKIADHSVKKSSEMVMKKQGDSYSHSEDTHNNDLKRKIEVKTVPSVKKSSVKDNPKLTVVTKSSDGKPRPIQDHRLRDDHGKNLHTSRIREEQVSKAREEKAREESRIREEQHKALAASASLAFEFKGSPEPPARPKLSSDYNSRPKTQVPNDYNIPRSKPSTVDPTPTSRPEDPASSPELVIEEEEKTEPTVKAIPDSSRHSPDSSSCVERKNANGGSRMSNGGSSVLGYDLEDVSPPSTSPDHPKREITQDALMESYVNNKRRRVDPNFNHRENSNELKLNSEHQKSEEKPKEHNKISKFSFSNSIERPREDKSYISNNGSLLKTKEDLAYSQEPVYNHVKGDNRPNFDERPIQSQDLSSSSTDLSNTDNKS